MNCFISFCFNCAKFQPTTNAMTNDSKNHRSSVMINRN